MPIVAYPKDLELSRSGSWDRDFSYPKPFIEALTNKFPDWEQLHKELNSKNRIGVFDMLEVCSSKLVIAILEEIGEVEHASDETLRTIKILNEIRFFIRDVLRKYCKKELCIRFYSCSEE